MKVVERNMSSESFEWDQLDLGEGFSQFNQGLVTILAWDSTRSPAPIGTAFIIGSFGETAIALTAAHVFKGVRDVQQPYQRHHPSALPEFLGDVDEICLDRKRVRALCCDHQGLEIATITWAVWDKKSDIGILNLRVQTEGKKFFETRYLLNDQPPVVGEEVCVLGYADMSVSKEHKEDNQESFDIKRRPILRKGRITAIHPEGHLLCRGPCIETSIPVFPGMSGGPVFRVGSAGEQILPFGLISSDSESDVETKNNRLISGATIVALLGAELVQKSMQENHAVLRLNAPYVQYRNEND